VPSDSPTGALATTPLVARRWRATAAPLPARRRRAGAAQLSATPTTTPLVARRWRATAAPLPARRRRAGAARAVNGLRPPRDTEGSGSVAGRKVAGPRRGAGPASLYHPQRNTHITRTRILLRACTCPSIILACPLGHHSSARTCGGVVAGLLGGRGWFPMIGRFGSGFFQTLENFGLRFPRFGIFGRIFSKPWKKTHSERVNMWGELNSCVCTQGQAMTLFFRASFGLRLF
jgi:hypothetical protein